MPLLRITIKAVAKHYRHTLKNDKMKLTYLYKGE
nr:MAG TPA: hypothetical protein [Caudoviricetes sp.]